MSDYDSPWKEVLDLYFELFTAFFFPHIHRDIDWSRGYETLDKELQSVVRDAELGRRSVDKLVKVWLRNGQESWVLIHVEVQSQDEPDFGRRMYIYNYRLFDRYNRVVVSLAVLGDDRDDWRPDQFAYSQWGCSVTFHFPAVKLLDYAGRLAELEAGTNPFAVVVLAHLKSMETRHDQDSRRAWKVRLVKSLYERGLSRENILHLFRFIDWMMDLPEELKNSFWQELQQYEEEKHMPYVTSVEQIGIEKGERKGLLEGIELGLKLKFGAESLQLLPELRQLQDVDKLRAVLQALETATSAEEVRPLCS